MTPNTIVTSVFRSSLQGLSGPWARMIVPLEVAKGTVLLCDSVAGAMSRWSHEFQNRYGLGRLYAEASMYLVPDRKASDTEQKR